MKAHIHQNGWSSFHPRLSDANDPDWSVGEIAAIHDVNAEYFDLDISSIVPEDTILVLFDIVIRDAQAQSQVNICPVGYDAKSIGSQVGTQVANVYCYNNMWCAVKGQTVRFMSTPKPSDFITMSLTIIGWWTT